MSAQLCRISQCIARRAAKTSLHHNNARVQPSYPLRYASFTATPGFGVKSSSEGKSYWQPKPANGYVVVSASPWYTPGLKFSQGTQVVAPGCNVREHTHLVENEVITVVSGTGHAVIDGQKFDMIAGTTITLMPHSTHSFHNDSKTTDLVFLWTISPPGLEDFFQSVGRERKSSDSAPAPFDRPADSAAIDANSNMKA